MSFFLPYKDFFNFLACVDETLSDFTSMSVMQQNGWIFDVAYSNMDRYTEQCSPSSWYGYSYGSKIGSVYVAFMGSGNATLSYGNCYNGGTVTVFLNENEIGHADGNIPDQAISFEYSNRNVLMLKETNTAIIKLNSLKISCNKGKRQLVVDSKFYYLFIIIYINQQSN